MKGDERWQQLIDDLMRMSYDLARERNLTLDEACAIVCHQLEFTLRSLRNQSTATVERKP